MWFVFIACSHMFIAININMRRDLYYPKLLFHHSVRTFSDAPTITHPLTPLILRQAVKIR